MDHTLLSQVCYVLFLANIVMYNTGDDIEGDRGEQESGGGFEVAAVGISAVLIVGALFVLLVIAGLWWWKKR